MWGMPGGSPWRSAGEVLYFRVLIAGCWCSVDDEGDGGAPALPLPADGGGGPGEALDHVESDRDGTTTTGALEDESSTSGDTGGSSEPSTGDQPDADADTDTDARRPSGLGADTVVVKRGELIGKPSGRDDAERILRTLAGGSHRVITGVCLLARDRDVVFSDEAKVYFETLNDAEIDYYIDNYKPFDKAGAYAIQEWIGLCKISKIEGTYANIMGLPVQRVYEELQRF